MDLSPQAVSALLVVIKEAGVSRFKCALFEVEFPPTLEEQSVVVVKAPPAMDPREAPPATPYHVAFGGRPPAFKPARRE